MAKLFTPFTLHRLNLKNRIVMAPMCMYSCMNEDGILTDFHYTHYTSRAAGQAGLIMLEASAVTPQGRISSRDLGIWSDGHIEGMNRLVEQIHSYDAKIGIQLAHAGRKSTLNSPIIAPSAIPYENMQIPQEMSKNQIKETIEAFGAAARRVKRVGFDVIEIHAAHGYLINQFLSPLSNHRTDEYGGHADNRYRFLGEIIDAVRAIWDGALFVRISANEYHPDGNQLEDYVYFATKMKQQGIHLIDCSSGGLVAAEIDAYPGYQVPLSEKIKHGAQIATAAVGLITESVHAEEILKNERADLIFLARELLRDPYWPRRAALELGFDLQGPKQYDRGWRG
ncbi:NADPH dehydrogenase NamA [Ferviditalea candida]|uniref:NADPH dehydrogenase NamA n=1 Tax=Ferviditalea candida TaxID=3108399 RepID=A0ABU5ZGL4_9BACL|nr:NADPH dehydrogenase NamA [Paenibacillaceae bacterium T2]